MWMHIFRRTRLLTCKQLNLSSPLNFGAGRCLCLQQCGRWRGGSRRDGWRVSRFRKHAAPVGIFDLGPSKVLSRLFPPKYKRPGSSTDAASTVQSRSQSTSNELQHELGLCGPTLASCLSCVNTWFVVQLRSRGLFSSGELSNNNHSRFAQGGGESNRCHAQGRQRQGSLLPPRSK